MNTVYW